MDAFAQAARVGVQIEARSVGCRWWKFPLHAEFKKTEDATRRRGAICAFLCYSRRLLSFSGSAELRARFESHWTAGTRGIRETADALQLSALLHANGEVHAAQKVLHAHRPDGGEEAVEAATMTASALLLHADLLARVARDAEGATAAFGKYWKRVKA